MQDVEYHVKQILTPELCLAAFRLKLPFVKGSLPSGTVVGYTHFRPSAEYMQAWYDLIFRNALLPLSKLPLQALLAVNWGQILPAPTAADYPEHCTGLISILDQQRIITSGYALRYTRAFFDPVCESLARQLIALPDDIRPDGKQAWLSRGYSIEDWFVRTLWFWAPLVHADDFMTGDRQHLKDWLHYMRKEAASHCGYSDPFAPLEAADDVDINAFGRIEAEGPPLRSYKDSGAEATVADYTFWWIRILNSHFAITDMCGHYPYWIRWKGLEWSEKDVEYMKKTNYHRYDPANEPFFEQVRKDHLEGVWRALEPTPEYERTAQTVLQNGHADTGDVKS